MAVEKPKLPGWLKLVNPVVMFLNRIGLPVGGTEYIGNAYTLLDLTAFGRSEDWEEPKGRAPRLHGADPTFTD